MSTLDSPKLTIIVPVYNEENTVDALLEKLALVELGFPREVLVVDDASTDSTPMKLAPWSSKNTLPVRVLRHAKNRGKGAAVRTAIAESKGHIVIILDADLEYDPAEIPKLIAPILDGKADVVYGNRFHGGPQRVVYFWHYLGNRLLTFLADVLTNTNLRDMETGYKAFRGELLRGLRLRSDTFAFEPEVTMKVAKRRCRMYEIPISYYGRTYAEGKKITWKDGVIHLLCMVWFRFFD
ncbi:MAG: glycosyltransferase family 2 protein [Nitrospirae bacterium]|nr:glycosyltransferase family 2 protein [Nitrospirota bacterium]